MHQHFTEDTLFEKINFLEKPLKKGEYEQCRFVQCDFSQANLSEFKFVDCEFTGCNLSMAKLKQSAFRGVHFKECKLLGLPFDTCNPLGFEVFFDGCTLNHSSFYQLKLKKTSFIGSTLHEVDFSECDLTQSVFSQCDLLNATFDGSILEGVDFRTAIHYSIDPEKNRMNKAKFSLEGLPGLLDKYKIIVDYK